MASVEDDVEKRRRINRDAAARSRRKQKEMVDTLKKKNLDLEATMTKLRYENSQLIKTIELYGDLARNHAITCTGFREQLLSFLRKPVNDQSAPILAHTEMAPPKATEDQFQQVENSPPQEDDYHGVAPTEEGETNVIEDGYVAAPAHVFTSPVPVSVASAGVMSERSQVDSAVHPPTEKRAQKRVAHSETHAQVCAKASRIEVPGHVRHFAKARKALGVSPLVAQAEGAIHVQVSASGVQQTTHHDADDGEKPLHPQVCYAEADEHSPGHGEPEVAEGQQVVPSGAELPAMLKEYEDTTNAISNPTQKIIQDGHKSIQTL